MVELIRLSDDQEIPYLRGQQRPRLWTVPKRHVDPVDGCKACEALDLKWGSEFKEQYAPGTPAGCGQYVGMDCLAWAKGVGYDLFDWQKWVLLNGFGTDTSGAWSALQSALIVPRQNGKGTVLEVLELYHMFVLRDNLLIHTSHELKTSQEHLLRVEKAIEENSSLRANVKMSGNKMARHTNGQEVIELKKKPTLILGPNGSRVRISNSPRLRFLARSRGSARGFTADFLVYDEAMILDTSSVGASLPTLSSRPNPQVWFTGSSGLEDSFQLAQLHNHIKKDDHTIFGAEWSIQEHKETCTRDEIKGRASNNFVICDNPLHQDRDDPNSVATANPSLGITIQVNYVRKMEFGSMDRTEFDRERLGVGQWPSEDAAWAVIPEDLWETLTIQIKKGERSRPMAFAVDVDPEGRSATISVAWWKAGQGIVIETAKSRPGTAWVMDTLKDWDKKYRPIAIVIPRSGPAAGLGDDVEKMWPDNPKWGTKVIRATVNDEAAAFAWFTQQCRNGKKQITHLAQERAPKMYAALGRAETRVVGDGGQTWSRRDSETDITPITSATLAAWGLNRKRKSYDLVGSIG